MSLTNVYYLHQKTGTDFSGATHWYLSNGRQLQVGPVDPPSQRRDEGKSGVLTKDILLVLSLIISSNLYHMGWYRWIAQAKTTDRPPIHYWAHRYTIQLSQSVSHKNIWTSHTKTPQSDWGPAIGTCTLNHNMDLQEVYFHASASFCVCRTFKSTTGARWTVPPSNDLLEAN